MWYHSEIRDVVNQRRIAFLKIKLCLVHPSNEPIRDRVIKNLHVILVEHIVRPGRKRRAERREWRGAPRREPEADHRFGAAAVAAQYRGAPRAHAVHAWMSAQLFLLKHRCLPSGCVVLLQKENERRGKGKITENIFQTE